MYVLSDEEPAAFSREEEPLTWRFVLCSLMVGIVLATALAFFVHHFVWPVQVVGDIERRFTWHENVNSVAVHGFDGSELYTLSGHCYVKDRGKVDDGRPHPGLAVVTCYDGGFLSATLFARVCLSLWRIRAARMGGRSHVRLSVWRVRRFLTACLITRGAAATDC